MSTSVRAYVVIGVPMNSNELLIRTPKTTLECTNGHVSKSTNPFCSKCGGRKTQKFSEVFIPSFIDYAKSINEDPKEVFEYWVEDPGDGMGFHRLPDNTHVLGIEIACTGNLMYSTEPKVITADALSIAEKTVSKVLLDLFGAKTTSPKIYLFGT